MTHSKTLNEHLNLQNHKKKEMILKYLHYREQLLILLKNLDKVESMKVMEKAIFETLVTTSSFTIRQKPTKFSKIRLYFKGD